MRLIAVLAWFAFAAFLLAALAVLVMRVEDRAGLAGTGRLALASGVIVTTALLLAEKTRLHAVVARIDDETLRYAARQVRDDLDRLLDRFAAAFPGSGRAPLNWSTITGIIDVRNDGKGPRISLGEGTFLVDMMTMSPPLPSSRVARARP